MGESTIRRSGPRSLFWPIVFIGAGVIWLLANFNIISTQNLYVLFRLWPLILIVVGVELLFGRQSPALGGLIGIGAVVLLVLLMLVGPSLGLAPDMDVTTETFSEARGDAESARVTLNTAVGKVTVNALTDSSDLVNAEIAHIGNIEFQVGGESEKAVSIGQEETSFNFGFNWLPTLVNSEELYWNVGLNPSVPLSLDVNGGAGDGSYDLSGLQLTGLSLNTGVGRVDITLPATDDDYTVDVNGGAGEVNVTVAEGADVAIDINGGVGNVNVDVPEGAAVRVDASSGVGNVNLPASFTRVSGNDDNPVGEDGVWESEGFNSAERQITINFNGGVGNLVVR